MARPLAAEQEDMEKTEIGDRQHLDGRRSRLSRVQDTATTIVTVAYRRRNSMQVATVRLRMRMGEMALGGMRPRLDSVWVEGPDRAQDLVGLIRGCRGDREAMEACRQGTAGREAMATGTGKGTVGGNMVVEEVGIGRDPEASKKKHCQALPFRTI
jgi:hypothetical protein